MVAGIRADWSDVAAAAGEGGRDGSPIPSISDCAVAAYCKNFVRDQRRPSELQALLMAQDACFD